MMTFEIHWLHVCKMFSPSVVTDQYPANSSIEVFGLILAFSAPTITDTTDGYSCGAYSFSVDWGMPNRIQHFSEHNAGAFIFESIEPLDANKYFVEVKIYFDAFPLTQVTTNFTMTVSSCLPSKIIPPDDRFQKFVHVIGNDYPTVGVIGNFTQVPACEAKLIYEIVDE